MLLGFCYSYIFILEFLIIKNVNHALQVNHVNDLIKSNTVV